MSIIQLTGEAKERAHIGIEIINKFYQESNLKETMNKTDEMLKILELVKSRKGNCDIDTALEIIRYGRSYAANVKDWRTA